MIKKKLLMIAATALCSFTNFASADINLLSKSKNLTNICPMGASHWEGYGVISSSTNSFIKCTYAGVGDLKEQTTPGEFIVTVSLKKTSGLGCPLNYGPEDWQGTCQDNQLVFKSPKVKLSGIISNNGAVADLTGTIMSGTFTVKEMHLEKK